MGCCRVWEWGEQEAPEGLCVPLSYERPISPCALS